MTPDFVTVNIFLMKNWSPDLSDGGVALIGSAEGFTVNSNDSDDETFTLGFETPSKLPTNLITNSLTTQKDIKMEVEKLDSQLEVESYLNFVAALPQLVSTSDPLQWWKVHRKQFPRVALGERKWLSVCSTSTSNERVFSICGIVNSVKRTRLAGKAIEAQVFIQNNYYELNPSKSSLIGLMQ